MATTEIDETGPETATDANAARGTYASARQRTSELYGSARERASSAYATTRQGAARARQRTANEIDASPIAALVGGLAVGAAIAALLPRTKRENEALGGIGGRIQDTARDAANAAREAGRERLDELGITRDSARDRLTEIARDALKTTAGAAARSVRSTKAGTRKR
jgi:ElaB/YqjD/DUF883 family membrane-anchored ribosome-binding protein